MKTQTKITINVHLQKKNIKPSRVFSYNQLLNSNFSTHQYLLKALVAKAIQAIKSNKIKIKQEKIKSKDKRKDKIKQEIDMTQSLTVDHIC